MHPDLAELLNLHDAPDGAAPAAQHASGCATCRAELERLERLRAAMRAAPAPHGRDAWPEIESALDRSARARTVPRPGWRFAGSLAAALAVAVGLALFNGTTLHGPSAVTTPAVDASGAAVPAPQSVAALMEESRRLELLLATMPAEPRVVRARTVLTADNLEDRIAWVDLALDARDASGVDATAAVPLWRQRVDLLNSLVAVRYAQARTASY
jgi:hypothetical protein